MGDKKVKVKKGSLAYALYGKEEIEERHRHRWENISMYLGRDNSAPQRIQDQFWRIHGRVVADAWWNVKREIPPKQESLAYVSQELLNESKGDVDRLSMYANEEVIVPFPIPEITPPVITTKRTSLLRVGT